MSKKSKPVRDALAAPHGQYTCEIKCVQCGAPRRVKPQDVWQVKLCLVCRDAKKKVKSVESIARLKERVVAKAESKEFARRVPRLVGHKLVWPTDEERAAWQAARKSQEVIWP